MLFCQSKFTRREVKNHDLALKTNGLLPVFASHFGYADGK